MSCGIVRALSKLIGFSSLEYVGKDVEFELFWKRVFLKEA